MLYFSAHICYNINMQFLDARPVGGRIFYEVELMNYRYDMRNVLWYGQSAQVWTEALPLGNGRIGAMIFGGERSERLALNEDTLWSGYPTDKNAPDAHRYFHQAVELVQKGEFEAAQQLIEQRMEGGFTESYMPLGDIWLEHELPGDTANYRRLLDMRSGLNICEFDVGNIHYTRTAFVSAPDQALVMRISASEPGAVTFSARFDTQLRVLAREAASDTLTCDMRAPSRVKPNYVKSNDPVIYDESPAKMGMRCRAQLRLRAKGGQLRAEGDRLYVDSADEVTLIFCARTSFNGALRHPETNGRDEKADLERDMAAVREQAFDRLLERQLNDFVPLFDRVAFEIEGDYGDMPTDERLRRFAANQDDKLLYMQIFNYGRYLLCASSRPGTRAANLQGIWNEHLRAPWSSNYTVNINTEMNYWPAEICAMGDMHAPLFELIESLRTTGRVTAQKHYGARGVVSHHNVDVWALSNPVGENTPGSAVWAFWPMSFGWLCRHLVEHYDYNPDESFLNEKVLPALEDCVAFYLDVLTPDADGKLVIAPATSPENVFMINRKRISVARSAAMSSAIVYEVFENFLRLARVAGYESDCVQKAADTIGKLKLFDIGSRGQLLEWDAEYEEAEPHHRHTSPLYALHPARLITPEAEKPAGGELPEGYRSPVGDQARLTEGCRRLLEQRGDDGTGWSLGWKINHWARLLDGDHALRLLKMQLRLVQEDPQNRARYGGGGGTYPNMFDAHPPFQIDGNFGTCAGIAEMFVQGYRGNLLLLPALPGEWRNGRMCGLKAPDGLTVDIEFADGALSEARIYAHHDIAQQLRVVYRGRAKYMNVSGGCTYTLRAEDFQ